MLTDNDSITEQVIREHLVELGYSPDSLQPDVMKEFIAELKELYENHINNEEIGSEGRAVAELETLPSVQIQSSKNDYGGRNSASNTSDWKDLVKQSAEAVRNADLQVNQDLETIQTAIDQNFNLNNFRSAALKQKSELELVNITQTDIRGNYKQAVPNGFIKPKLASKPKKDDPVARFHQHQAQWNKDKFLKRLYSNTAPGPSFQGRWGGVA
jgi:hypothetical protein